VSYLDKQLDEALEGEALPDDDDFGRRCVICNDEIVPDTKKLQLIADICIECRVHVKDMIKEWGSKLQLPPSNDRERKEAEKLAYEMAKSEWGDYTLDNLSDVWSIVHDFYDGNAPMFARGILTLIDEKYDNGERAYGQ
jgi:hypothetical protein